MELTVASYNIHSGVGSDGRFDLDRTAAVLEELDADVIALQEVGDFHGLTPTDAHPELLAEATGRHLAFGPNVHRNGRRYGNAVLSRLPIKSSRNYDLSVGRREPRGALRVDLELGPGTLHVFCLHLGLAAGERRRQEALLLSADILRDAARVDPLIVCGDFNYWWIRPMPRLFRKAIRDAALELRASRATYPSRWPMLRLDRIFVDSYVAPRAIEVHHTKTARLASDHLPLKLRFETIESRKALVSPPVELIG